MKYSEKEINALRENVRTRLSQKRFDHTLGVERMALRIGEKCLPEKLDMLRAAALLHDISKEYSEAEHLELIKRHDFSLGDEEFSAPAIWHSVTAPLEVEDSFPEYADADILSAVRNHTVGSPDMTVFDEIIFLADYIEEGRKYESCVKLREDFLKKLEKAENEEQAILLLHGAVASSLRNSMNELSKRGLRSHSSTRLAYDAILAKTER